MTGSIRFYKTIPAREYLSFEIKKGETIRVIDIDGKQVGLVHGSGGPWDLAERVRTLFGEVDIIVFGHSHLSFNDYVRGTLMFNPGRARDSYGILTVKKEIAAEIIKV